MPQQKLTLTLDCNGISRDSWEQPPVQSEHVLGQEHCPRTPKNSYEIESLIEAWGDLAIQNETKPSNTLSEEDLEKLTNQSGPVSLFDRPMAPSIQYDSLNYEHQHLYINNNPHSNESPKGIWDHPTVCKELIYQPLLTDLPPIPTLNERRSHDNMQSQGIMSLPRIRLRPRNAKFYPKHS